MTICWLLSGAPAEQLLDYCVTDAVAIDQKQIEDLAAHPAESLNVEIKGWISPEDNEGIAKIAKATIAIYNRNGGFLLVGFDDKTLQPDILNIPANIRQLFHQDKIQEIVSRFAYDPFEITVGFASINGNEYPVISIPNGVRVPVATKRDLISNGKKLIAIGEIYFRTLASNGRPSTAPARPSDWKEIIEICFENREADIGRFLRRHLAGSDLKGLLTATTVATPTRSLEDRVESALTEGEKRFEFAVQARTFKENEAAKLNGGSWSVAVVVEPPHPNAIPDTNFFNVVASSNPQYTGWPVWLDSRGFRDGTAHPQVIDKAWQALVVSFESWSDHVDFMRLDPTGIFYLRRVLQDDLTPKISPGTELDVILTILRITETLAVALTMTKALGWEPEKTTLGIGFRWQKLSGRELSSWANPEIHISGNHIAHDNEANSFIEIPLDTPPSSLAPYVEKILNQLFVLFGGYTLSPTAYEKWVQRLIERRL